MEIQVQVENDHIERITAAKPLAALSELIWNAYDADASEIKVDLESGALTKLGTIRVTDNGTGIPFEKAEKLFSALGGSWKKSAHRTPGGRAIHGEKGQGRFKAFALGNLVTWTSNSQGRRFEIQAISTNLKRFLLSDPVKSLKSGCVVEISQVHRDYEISAGDGFSDQIRDIFALQLYEDPNLSIIYDGITIEAKDAIHLVRSFDVEATLHDASSVRGILEIVEWKSRVERKLMLCLPGRFSFLQMSPGIQARGFDFTAYLTSEHFQNLVDLHIDSVPHFDPAANALIEAAKEKLREHFRMREAEQSRDRITEWKEAKVYPYNGEAATLVERNERQVFDVVALSLADYSAEFNNSSAKQKRLVLQLLKASIESGGSSLSHILESVLDLPKSKQEELAELLRKTTLTAVINAAKAATDRLDFLKALQLLIYDRTSKRQLLERSQLHKIIERETWVFGERYNLTNSDKDLTAVLKSHLALLDPERVELSPETPVLDAEGRVAIVDLMLSCRIPTPTDDDREHLIVELKRPSKSINEDVITQVRKYAKAVALDDRFRNSSVTWDFLVVSNSMTRDAELETRQTGKPRGLVLELDEPKIRVWVKTWDQIIRDAEGALTFYRRRLEYQADDVDALMYLRSIKSDYLSDEVRARIEALAEDAE